MVFWIVFTALSLTLLIARGAYLLCRYIKKRLFQKHPAMGVVSFATRQESMTLRFEKQFRIAKTYLIKRKEVLSFGLPPGEYRCAYYNPSTKEEGILLITVKCDDKLRIELPPAG